MTQITDAEIHKALFDWIKEVTGADDGSIIRANQNGPEPSRSFEPWVIPGVYFTYQILDDTFSDFANTYKSESGPDDVEAVYLNRTATVVSVNCYGNESRLMLKFLTQSMYLLPVRLIFQPLGMVLLKCSGIRDLTFLGDTDFKSRHQADFEFRMNTEVTEVYERIHEFEIDGTYNP